MLRSRVLTILLVMSWLICGAVVSLAGFFGFFQSWLWIFLLLPLCFLSLLVWRVRGAPLMALGFIWILHLLQVFVPETGFDALWYHLPIAELLSEQQQFTFLPELYQTANPLFTDSIFALGYLFWQSLGTKLVAFGFALSLIAVTYQLGRIFLSRKWSLLLVISVSLFQVVSWQAASFYIDVAKAVFDLAGLWLVLEGVLTKKRQYKQKYLLLAALAFSASLASKAFSIALLPFMLFSLATTVPISVFALAVFSVPFYLFSYQHTGSAFFSIEKHVGQLDTFTNASSLFDLVLGRVFELPRAFLKLFFTKDYTSPLLGFLPVALVLLRGKIFKTKPLLLLVLFTLNQLAIWWFVPPLSTRYALAGFVSGLLLVLLWLSQRKEKFWPVLILFIFLLSLIPRLVVAKRSLTYLAGQQTQEAYVEQFKDANNAWLLESPPDVDNLPPINIEYLRSVEIDSPAPVIEETLASGSNYQRFIASYTSEGNKVFGLLTIPDEDPPTGGFPAIIFNHGYIPPNQYRTTEKYVAYVDYLARNGFVVFKIDLRGHGDSEGTATGSYFSPKYTIDAISALKSLQKFEEVNPERIGMWGHSMAGNLTLRAMLVEQDIRAGVIWAGAVYSYEDFAKYRLQDSSYVRQPRDPHYAAEDLSPEFQSNVSMIRESPEQIDFADEFWSGISLTKNLRYLDAPLQLHHAKNDTVVNIGYSIDLAAVLQGEGKVHEFFEYSGGGHNIDSPYFEQAMERTVKFFKENL